MRQSSESPILDSTGLVEYHTLYTVYGVDRTPLPDSALTVYTDPAITVLGKDSLYMKGSCVECAVSCQMSGPERPSRSHGDSAAIDEV